MPQRSLKSSSRLRIRTDLGYRDTPDNQRLQILKAGDEIIQNTNQQGEVGIFWFFHDRLLSSSVPYPEGEAYGDCINGPADHVTFWPAIQRRFRKELPLIVDYEYDQVPRGRVVYRSADDTFFVYGSERFVRDATQKQRVVEQFNLVGQRVVFKADEHYGPVLGMLVDD